MRLSTFWELMTTQFGDTYARSVAKDHVFAQLGNRTAERALAEGVDTQVVWRAVCEAFEVPERLRLSGSACNAGWVRCVCVSTCHSHKGELSCFVA